MESVSGLPHGFVQYGASSTLPFFTADSSWYFASVVMVSYTSW